MGGRSRVKSSRSTVAQFLAKSKLQSSSSDRDRGSIALACTLYADYAGEGTWSVSRAGAGLKYSRRSCYLAAHSQRTPVTAQIISQHCLCLARLVPGAASGLRYNARLAYDRRVGSFDRPSATLPSHLTDGHIPAEQARQASGQRATGQRADAGADLPGYQSRAAPSIQ